MNIHVPVPPAAGTNRHPADELKDIRDDIKSLERREKELKTLISGDRELRVGDDYHAIVSERSRETTDWKGLALSLGASEAAIAAATKTTTSEVVELAELPDLHEVLRTLLNDELIVVDCETTGFSPAAGDRIVSVGAMVTLVAEEGEGLHLTFGNRGFVADVNPGRASSPSAAAVHGLTDEYLATRRAFAEIAQGLRETIGKGVIVAHNAPFDIGFLNAEFERAGMKQIANRVIDSRVLSKLIWPGEPASLDAMAERLGVDRSSRDARHDALEDCRVLAACLPGLIAAIQERLVA